MRVEALWWSIWEEGRLEGKRNYQNEAQLVTWYKGLEKISTDKWQVILFTLYTSEESSYIVWFSLMITNSSLVADCEIYSMWSWSGCRFDSCLGKYLFCLNLDSQYLTALMHCSMSYRKHVILKSLLSYWPWISSQSSAKPGSHWQL
jgi:hypothetical protein